MSWGERVQFADVVIRQAHPGPDVPAYHSFEQKMSDAERYRREEGIPWPVLVDDLRGTAHQVYGGLADPTYLIDADGNVAFYSLWTRAVDLDPAIRELLGRGGRGVVAGGLSHLPQMGAVMTDGWRGLRRGLPQSFTDMMWAAPGSPLLPWAGYQLKPVLAPFTLRSKPLPPEVKVGLVAGAAVAALAVWALARPVIRSRPRRSS